MEGAGGIEHQGAWERVGVAEIAFGEVRDVRREVAPDTVPAGGEQPGNRVGGRALTFAAGDVHYLVTLLGVAEQSYQVADAIQGVTPLRGRGTGTAAPPLEVFEVRERERPGEKVIEGIYRGLPGHGSGNPRNRPALLRACRDCLYRVYRWKYARGG